MAIYRIYPSEDTFITSHYVQSNHGIDEILELGNYQILGDTKVSRTIVKFDNVELKNVVNNTITNTNFSSSLKLYTANTLQTPTTYSIFAYPVFDSWDNGTGKFGDVPINRTGASWSFPLGGNSGSWNYPTASDGSYGDSTNNVTGSFPSTSPFTGGSWYTGSNGVNVETSQSFAFDGITDIDIDVTNTVLEFYNDNISNNGIILKFEDRLEYNDNVNTRHKYFSRETNTIYSPHLSLKWDDSSYETGSLQVLDNDQCYISVKNNKGRYTDTDTFRFKLTARPKYPTRTFTTGSIYSSNYALPSSSYWAVKDEYTEEMIIDFDTDYTKISCDSNGPYFNVYMKSLPPERNYRILVKSTLNDSTIVVNDINSFKVVRNG